MRMRRTLCGWARAGFFDGDSFAAQGTILRVPRLHFEGGEGEAGHAEIGASAAAVDDGAGGCDIGVHGSQDFDYFTGAASGGDHVFDDHGRLAGFDGEAAAKDHFAVWVAFCEEESDAESTGDFMADDQTSQSRGGDKIARGKQRGQLAPHFFRNRRMLEHQRALEIFVGVQATGEPEMAFQVGSGFPENLHDSIRHSIHSIPFMLRGCPAGGPNAGEGAHPTYKSNILNGIGGEKERGASIKVSSPNAVLTEVDHS